jgi:hypothetical protein
LDWSGILKKKHFSGDELHPSNYDPSPAGPIARAATKRLPSDAGNAAEEATKEEATKRSR